MVSVVITAINDFTMVVNVGMLVIYQVVENQFFLIKSRNRSIMKTIAFFKGYIGEFEIIDDHRSGKIVVNLTGRLNKVSFHEYVLNILYLALMPFYIHFLVRSHQSSL